MGIFYSKKIFEMPGLNCENTEHKAILKYHMKESVKLSRKLIIDGNAVYELDENCMLKKRLEDAQVEKNQMEEKKRSQENMNEYKRMLRRRSL